MARERGIRRRNQGWPSRGCGFGAVPRPGHGGSVGVALASRRRHVQGRAPRRQRRRCGRGDQEGRFARAVHWQVGEAVQLGPVRIRRARGCWGARPPALPATSRARRCTEPVLGRLVLWHLLDSVKAQRRRRQHRASDLVQPGECRTGLARPPREAPRTKRRPLLLSTPLLFPFLPPTGESQTGDGIH